MLNREEVLYNSNSLVSTWLFGKENVTDFEIEMVGDNCNDRYRVELSECGNKICELLCENGGKYKLLNLFGNIGGKKELIGSIDII